MSTNKETNWEDLELGALWTRTSESSGNEYMTGELKVGGKPVSVIVFKNKHKTESKHPTWRVYTDPNPKTAAKPQLQKKKARKL